MARRQPVCGRAGCRSSVPTGLGYGGTSATSLLIGAGSKVFATQSNLAYQVGNYVRASSAANGANFMEGPVTAYAAGSMTINVSKTGGSGTFADWRFATSGAPGTGDLLSTNNLSDVANAGTSRSNLGLAIGTNVEAWNANLDTFAALGNWKVAYTNGSGNPVALTLGAANTIFGSNSATSAPAFASLDAWGGLVKAGNQTITGGFKVTPNNLGTTIPSFTLDPTLGNYQYGTNNAAFTLTAPANDCAVDILVTNGATAGAITFSGFTVSSSTGDALTTTNTNKFVISIRRINAVSTYVIKALQ
jgi:hypothetical protein